MASLCRSESGDGRPLAAIDRLHERALTRVQHHVVRFTAALLHPAGGARSKSICARHFERQHSAYATRRGFLLDHAVAPLELRASHVESSWPLLALQQSDVLWSHKRWAVKAMVAQGRPAEAITYAERCRSPWASDTDIDRLCEQILLASGHSDEAYARYAISANRAATYLGWFRAVARKYPDKPALAVLEDLVRHTPGDEGKWFAAAKDAKLFDEAVALANAAPCDPKTLTRAARDFAQTNPTFAVEAGLAALRWLVRGYGYEITSVDVRAAYSHTLTAAAHAGVDGTVRTRIRTLLGDPAARSGFVASVIGKEVGLD